MVVDHNIVIVEICSFFLCINNYIGCHRLIGPIQYKYGFFGSFHTLPTKVADMQILQRVTQEGIRTTTIFVRVVIFYGQTLSASTWNQQVLNKTKF